MNYREREYEFVAIDNESFGGYIRMPSLVTKFFIKANVKKIRKMMGGVSQDISVRPIYIEDRNIKGYNSDFRIRLYKPEGDAKRPLMVFMHGGGWIGGSIDAVHDYCKAVADQADCVVLSVDYHLAPEAPFPEGLEDSYAAVKWGVEHAEELNIDVDNVIVSGDSAGGNYSAIISILARDRTEFHISRQILLYPATDLSVMASDMTNKSERAFGEAILEMYLKKSKEPLDSPLVSPMHCQDHTKLPDALIVVGDLDFLKDSSLAYANKLKDAGNKVQFSLYKNTRHAFIDSTGNCKQAEDFIGEVNDFINGRL
ncbi:alpha/beta hydrolase [Paenibacillus terrigena]|uniref:alpha/beta hydrolase n=1 Tax=Paenibacillus terrigena TaxID=369333 RepID=UPI0028D37FB8|nr:alpha/beta hydrolase [Paenibacillus terrigena]